MAPMARAPKSTNVSSFSKAKKLNTTLESLGFHESEVTHATARAKMYFRCPVALDNVFNTPNRRADRVILQAQVQQWGAVSSATTYRENGVESVAKRQHRVDGQSRVLAIIGQHSKPTSAMLHPMYQWTIFVGLLSTQKPLGQTCYFSSVDRTTKDRISLFELDVVG